MRSFASMAYKGTQRTLDLYKTEPDMQEIPHGVAHLIHGSSEGRFTIRYAPGHLTREEIEQVGYEYADLAEMQAPLSGRDDERRLEHDARRRRGVPYQHAFGGVVVDAGKIDVTEPQGLFRMSELEAAITVKDESLRRILREAVAERRVTACCVFGRRRLGVSRLGGAHDSEIAHESSHCRFAFAAAQGASCCNRVCRRTWDRA